MDVFYIIDDEPLLVKLVTILLSKLGWEPWAFSSFEKALSAAQESYKVGNPVRGVLLDIGVVGNDKLAETIEKFKENLPDTRVIITSGDVNVESLKKGCDGTGIPFDAIIQKPFTFDDLSETLNDLFYVSQKKTKPLV